MENNGVNAGQSRSQLPALVILVLFVGIILLVSIVIAGVAAYLLVRFGVLPPDVGSNMPLSVILALAVCLISGLLLTLAAGSITLRPLKAFVSATKVISGGDFNVRLPVAGPQEMRNLAEGFNEMARELGSIETLRHDFVSNISHEFKTPVASIRGFAKLLQKEGLTPRQRQEYIEIIISESERLSNLCSNSLLLSRLDNTQIVTEQSEFMLDEQLRRCILSLGPLLDAKGLAAEVSLPEARIYANEEMLHHVWLNLLNNAIKFSPPGGEITVVLAVGHNNVSVSVSDCGCGMDSQTLKHIYDRFYQGDPSRATEGSGLGLALVKRVLELCRGEISVDSAVGAGTTFTVTLPVGSSAPRGR